MWRAPLTRCLLGLLPLAFPLVLSGQWDMGVAGSLAFPLGPNSLTEAYGWPMGGGLSARYSLRERWRVGLSVSYWQLSYSADPITTPGSGDPELGLAPLLLGVEYAVLPVTRTRPIEFYAGLDVGYLLIREVQDQGGVRRRLPPTGALAAAPVAGVRYPLSDALIAEARLVLLAAFPSGDAQSLAFRESGIALLPSLALGMTWRIAPDRHPRYRPRTRRPPRPLRND